MSILEVANLSKSYAGSQFALQNISFSIPYGSITGFIGENGAGKTTTMGTVLGTLHKDDGVIKIFGEEMGHDKINIKEDIGVVFDSMNFSGNLNARQLGKVFRRIYRQWDQEKYDHYLTLFSLPAEEKISGFSRGMSMKLSVAVALSHDARLLILDEATSGLDPVGREELLDVLLGFVKDKQRGILLSSHITSDIEKVADELIFIKNGSILLKESKDNLLQHYAILQCTQGEFQQIHKDCIVAYRHKENLIEVLVSHTENKPGTFEKKDFSIDDITLLLMRGKKM